jgi:transposase
MQILVSAAGRQVIEDKAEREGKTLSAVIEEQFSSPSRP